MKIVSATHAARHFSDVLDEVEHSDEEFVIKRHGREVARICAVGPRRVTWGEFVEAMRNGPKPDPDFAEDLRKIREAQGELPADDPWERYSTRRS